MVDNRKENEITNQPRKSNISLIGTTARENRENGREETVRELIQDNFPELKDVKCPLNPSHVVEKRSPQSISL